MFKLRRKDHSEIVSRILAIRHARTRRVLLSSTMDELFETLFSRLSSIIQADGSPPPWPNVVDDTEEYDDDESSVTIKKPKASASKQGGKSFLPLDGM
jgi:hypothetical protein